MFWKKKDRKERQKSRDRLFSWLERMLRDRRRSFRYAPEATMGIFVRVDGDSVLWPVRDVSAGGCCFEHPGMRPGDLTALHLISHTPSLPLDLLLRAEVLGRTKEGECHCVFLNLRPDEEETLHRFSLAAQRHEARQRRMLRVRELWMPRSSREGDSGKQGRER